MHLTSKVVYQIELAPVEFNLINKALRRTDLQPGETEAMKKLADDLINKKISLGEHHYREIQKLKKNVEDGESS